MKQNTLKQLEDLSLEQRIIFSIKYWCHHLSLKVPNVEKDLTLGFDINAVTSKPNVEINPNTRIKNLRSQLHPKKGFIILILTLGFDVSLH